MQSFGHSVQRNSRVALAFLERNFNLTKRYWAWELVWITYNIVNGISVTYIAAGANAVIPGFHISQSQLNTAILVLVIGTAVWSYISTCFDDVAMLFTIEKWEGTLEYTFMAPIKRITMMFGASVYAVIHGFVLTAIQLVVMAMFFHIDLSQANFWTAIIILLLGTASFVGFGFITSVLPMLFTEYGDKMGFIVRSVILLVSGVYYPVTVLPKWMQTLSAISPATYVLDGLRRSLINGQPIWQMWSSVIILIISGAVSIPAGLWVFRKGEEYAKRTGKLKRNG